MGREPSVRGLAGRKARLPTRRQGWRGWLAGQLDSECSLRHFTLELEVSRSQHVAGKKGSDTETRATVAEEQCSSACRGGGRMGAKTEGRTENRNTQDTNPGP